MASLDFTEHSKLSHVEVLRLGKQLEKLLADFGLDLHRSRSLSRYLRDAEAMATFEQGKSAKIPEFSNLIGALHLHWICEAVFSGPIPAKFKNKLLELLDGNLDLLQRRRTRAKDVLWEFEVRNVLARGNIASHFEEPDLIIPDTPGTIGVSCKKVYSERNLGKTLSIAVSQIERRNFMGIVALNIDDLLPGNSLIRVASGEEAIAHLKRQSEDFSARHEHHFRHYLGSGRALFVLISCGAFVDTYKQLPQFNVVRQSVSWRIEGTNVGAASNIMSAFSAN